MRKAGSLAKPSNNKQQQQKAAVENPFGDSPLLLIQGIKAQGTLKANPANQNVAVQKVVSSQPVKRPTIVHGTKGVVPKTKQVDKVAVQQPNKPAINNEDKGKSSSSTIIVPIDTIANSPKNLSIPETVLLPTAPVEPRFGKVNVKYNHYNNEFDIVNGRMSHSIIDQTYCFNFVFKGQYSLQLRILPSKELVPSDNKVFSSLEDGGKYEVLVDEDPEEIANQVSKPYNPTTIRRDLDAAGLNQPKLKKKNNAVESITEELKGLTYSELQEKGDKYKRLLEERDLEDILYS